MSLQVPSTKRSFVRGDRNTTESIASFSNLHSLFKNTELGGFCSRKLFEVVFANELTPQCSELLDGIIEYHDTKKEDSNIVFITRRSIINFVKEVVNNFGENIEHPPNLLNHLRRVCSDLHNSLRRKDEISRKQLTLIMKHKLINEMYTQYAIDAKIDHEVRENEELLTKLQRVDYQKQIRLSEMKISTSDMKWKSSKCRKIGSDVEFRMSDYTSYALSNNLHDSDDLKDHVYFYVFVGFQDPCLLNQLTRYRVPVNCILQISRKKDVEDTDLTYFWKKINEISQNGEKFEILEDVAQMKYIHEGNIPDDEDRPLFFEKRLKELEELLLKILDLKRKHIYYIEHLHPYTFKNMDLNFGPYLTYKKSLENIPSESITIPYLVHSMLLEVEKIFEGEKQDIFKDPTSKNMCPSNRNRPQLTEEMCRLEKMETQHTKKICPFTLKYFKKGKPKELHLKKENFRKFYEGDLLNLNMFLAESRRAQAVASNDSKTLMHQIFFHSIELLKNSKDVDFSMPDVNQGTPSSQKSLLSLEQINHFLNLLYLSSMKMVEDSTKFHEDPSRNFLCTPHELYENRNFLPKSLNILQDSHNWYSKFDGMLFRWKEPLSTSLLAQRLFEAQQEFSEVNSKYCESTGTLVVHFHQNLTFPGTRTKIWKESLRTLTCFRDFCNFYYFEEAAWFSKFQPMKHINYETYTKNEEKYIFERIIESNDKYKEYEKFLIPYYICENFNSEHFYCPNLEKAKKFSHVPPIMKPNLEDIISELKNYPSSSKLWQNCAKSFSTSYLSAYDEKPPRFGLTGTTNDFFSHDGVRITIDTCRFYFEDFKLSMALKFEGHTLIGHQKNGHLDPHLILKDGTVIKLILPIPKCYKDEDSCISEDIEILKSILGFKVNKFRRDTEMLTESSVNLKEIPVFRPELKHVIPVYDEELEKINFDPHFIRNSINKSPCEKKIIQDIKILSKMNNTNVFQEYVDSSKLKYVTRKYRFLEIPYSSFIRRILTRPMKHKCNPVYRQRKFRTKNYKKNPHTYEIDSPHIKLTLRNGLTLESFTSSRNEEITVVKQTHLERCKYESISSEDYRLFLDQGQVLIRFLNGNMKIMDSNGIIVDFKQNQKYKGDMKKCFRNIDTCRKMIYKLSLSKNRIFHDVHDYSRSRRGHLMLSKKLKGKSNSLEALTSLNTLYSSIQMYTLEGFALKLKEQNISKKHFARVLRDWDFQTKQMCLERTDGMKIFSRSNGDQTVTYPDGTKITKFVHEGKKLEFYSKKDKQGWVVINHSYLYEHPFYCPIKFDSRTNKSSVSLKQNTELVLSKTSTLINFAGKCELSIDTENMSFTKYCSKCGSKCICDITVNSKDSDGGSSQMLVCKDSYRKEFTSDFSGRCQINTNFIEGELNSQNCNHVLKRDYHRAFLINEDMTGDLLWNDKMVIRELQRMEDLLGEDPPKANIEQLIDKCSNSTGISFTKNYYQSLKEEFVWVENSQPPIYPRLTTNLDSEKSLKYQICRNIFNILHENEINVLYEVVKKLMKKKKINIKPEPEY